MINKLENSFDKAILYIKKQFTEPERLVIQTYNGYGDINSFRVMGRVLETEMHLENPDDSHDSTSTIKNIWYMVKRFESDEVPNIEIRITINSKTHTTTTDEEGFFLIEIEERLKVGWNEVEVFIDASMLGLGSETVSAIANVNIVDPEVDYLIISDIDDTIMKSYIPTPLKMLKELITKGSRSRVAFEGTGEFYKALARGKGVLPKRPLFFVSGSPWNIYDVLEDFLSHNDFPNAPLFLKDLGITDSYILAPDTIDHKIKWISEILDFFQSKSVILIGDSGQEDATIYHEVVNKYPLRVSTIYIRDVVEGKKSVEFRSLVEEVKSKKSKLIIFEKTVEAAEHAQNIGLINMETKKKVEAIREPIKKTTAL